jgi:hypothetical protein
MIAPPVKARISRVRLVMRGPLLISTFNLPLKNPATIPPSSAPVITGTLHRPADLTAPGRQA